MVSIVPCQAKKNEAARPEFDGPYKRVAVISGLGNVESIAEKIINGKDVGYDLIEVMACPGGCICGAGHPVPDKINTLQKRQDVLVDIDKTSKYRKLHENPDILRLYNEFYKEANSKLAHKLLHTSYSGFYNDPTISETTHKEESTFVTHRFTVCMCNECKKKGSEALNEEITERISTLKMDSFMEVRSIKFIEDHEGTGILLTLYGKRIEPDKLSNLYKSVGGDAPRTVEDW